jgi:membrane associated rhomboid family serine protease
VVENAYRPPQSFGLLPPVIKNLLILNGLGFLAQIAFGGWPVYSLGEVNRWFALWPAGTPEIAPLGSELVAVPRFYPWQLVTTAFLHGDLWHLALNMLALWMFGLRVEQEMGSRRFAFYYLACVLGASTLQLLVTSAPFLFGIGTPSISSTVGASGGVLGVLAAYGLLYPREKIYVFPLPVPIEVRWLVLGYAAMDLWAGVSGSPGGVANFAHLGGMITGALLVQYWRGRLPIRPRVRRSA